MFLESVLTGSKKRHSLQIAMSFFLLTSGGTMPDLQTKQTYSLMTLILVAAGTAAVVVYASNNVRAARQIIG